MITILNCKEKSEIVEQSTKEYSFSGEGMHMMWENPSNKKLIYW